MVLNSIESFNLSIPVNRHLRTPVTIHNVQRFEEKLRLIFCEEKQNNRILHEENQKNLIL